MMTTFPPKRVRITAQGHYHGQEAEVLMMYYDHLHTGDSPDIYFIRLADGRQLRVLESLVEVLDEAAEASNAIP